MKFHFTTRKFTGKGANYFRLTLKSHDLSMCLLGKTNLVFTWEQCE